MENLAFNRLKRVLAIHDMSGVGKCSLTAALPIISAANIECSTLPTAILSTHTGGFTDMVVSDFEPYLIPFVEHWLREKITFDSIYTGYLASAAQAGVIDTILDMLKESHPDYKTNGSTPLIIVDPVMADQGKFYQHFDESIIEGMKKLAKKADVLVPNITEACFLLGIKYEVGPKSTEYVEDILRKLAEFGPKKIVITDISLDAHHLGATSYDVEKDEISFNMSDLILGHYHGTGDVFGSALTSGLVHGFSLAKATRLAVDFTCASIAHSAAEKTETRMGVRFEAELSTFGSIFLDA